MKLLLALIIGSTTFTLAAGTIQSVPKPYHEVLHVTVKSADYQQNKLVSVSLTAKKREGSPYPLTLSNPHDLRSFKDYAPIVKGQTFKLMLSILTDEKGESSAHYSVVKKIEKNKLSRL